jgi:hypothetical protein
VVQWLQQFTCNGQVILSKERECTMRCGRPHRGVKLLERIRNLRVALDLMEERRNHLAEVAFNDGQHAIVVKLDAG